MLENLGIGQPGGPAVGGEDGDIQGAMRLRQPGRTGIVQVRQDALFNVVRGRIRRVEPGVTKTSSLLNHTGCSEILSQPLFVRCKIRELFVAYVTKSR